MKEDREAPATKRIERPWNAAWRRRWCIALHTFALGFMGFAAARYWPYQYRSDALVLLEQRKIAENYVSSNVVITLEEQMDQMTQQVLSRTELRRLIDEFHLYRRELQRLPIEEVVDRMRSKIKVDLVPGAGRGGQPTAFRVSFSYSDPVTAQVVTRALTSRIIAGNAIARTQGAAAATDFFDAELDRAKKDLEAQEERLRAYKMNYIGELPDQLNANLQMLSILQSQLHTATTAVDRAEQDKVYLEAMRAEYRAVESRLRKASPADEARAIRAKALDDLREKLRDLRNSYTADHPDVKRLEKQIASLEAAPTVVAAEAQSSPATADNSLLETESRLKAINVEVENSKREAAQLRSQIAQLEKHLSQTPVREQQLAEVTRTYNNAQTNFQNLLQKKRQSELATNLERREEGQRLRILDPASLSEKPEDPTREEVILIAWGAGLCFGLGLAILRELTDHRIRSVGDLAALTSRPNLGCMPEVLSRGERRGKFLRHALEAVCALCLAAASVGAGLATYLKS